MRGEAKSAEGCGTRSLLLQLPKLDHEGGQKRTRRSPEDNDPLEGNEILHKEEKIQKSEWCHGPRTKRSEKAREGTSIGGGGKKILEKWSLCCTRQIWIFATVF